MSDKKNEDYAIRMPDSGMRSPYGGEKDPFIPQRPARVVSNQVLPQIAKIENSPPISILAYCLSSISMTVVNKYVVSGSEWNLNFFYLAVQVLVAPPIFATVMHFSNVYATVDRVYSND